MLPTAFARLFSFRFGLLLSAAVVPYAAVAAAKPAWATAAGIDVWNVSRLEQQIAACERQQDQLEVTKTTIHNRIAAKEALVAELIGGRLSLADTVEEFLALNAALPAATERIRADYPGDSDEESTARNVIDYALRRVPAADRPALSRRLAAELADLVGSGCH
jgi:hypothetical protein